MRYFLIIFLSLVFFSCKTYQLTQQDLQEPFEFDDTEGRLACHKKNGEKIWLYVKNGNFELYKNDEPKPYRIYMPSVSVKNDTLYADILIESSKKALQVAISDISFARVTSIFPSFVPFFNPDSIANVVRIRNDSLGHFCNADTRYSIYLKPLIDSLQFQDSIILQENACYNMTFTDNTIIKYGIIKKIISDSIYITNYLNYKVAKKEKRNFKVLKYSINDIRELELLRSEECLFTTITNEQYHFQVVPYNKETSSCPTFFSWNKITGEIYYNVNWLIESGYVPIKDINGVIYW